MKEPQDFTVLSSAVFRFYFPLRLLFFRIVDFAEFAPNVTYVKSFLSDRFWCFSLLCSLNCPVLFLKKRKKKISYCVTSLDASALLDCVVV